MQVVKKDKVISDATAASFSLPAEQCVFLFVHRLFHSPQQTESVKKGTNQRWKRLLKEGAEKSRYGKGICEAVDLILTNITIHIEPWLPCGGLYPVYRLDFRRSLEYSLHVSSGKSAESLLEQHLVIEPSSFLVKLEFKNAFFFPKEGTTEKKNRHTKARTNSAWREFSTHNII